MAVRLVTHMASSPAAAACFRSTVPKLPGATRQKLQVGLMYFVAIMLGQIGYAVAKVARGSTCMHVMGL